MRFSRFTSVLGVAAASALVLSACASTGDSNAASKDQTKSISIAETNSFTSLNPESADGNSDINSKIASLTHGGFLTISDQLEVLKNDKSFGTVEVLSKSPLKVKYTLNEGVEWDYGNKVDAGDFLLSWAAMSGHFDGKEKDGVTYFNFAGDSEGLGMTDMPELSDDVRSMTLTYSEPFIDYETAFDMGVPAHVVAKRAGMSEEDLVNLIKTAKPGEENEQLRKVADVWNKGFSTTVKPDDASLLASSGPYKIKDIVENQSVTLVKNDKYKGPAPKIDEITIRTLGDANAQIQALNNGEVDIISPAASVDTIQQLEKAQGIKTLVGDQLSYDHLDLNFGSDVFADEDVRKAFLLTIPRQEIVDKLIKPMSDKADVLDSQVFVSSQEQYSDAKAKNGSSEYDPAKVEENIAKAKELLKGKTPEVRILYNNNNPVRSNTFQMIQASAEKAGFKVIDKGSADWSKQLPKGDYDASLFGWVSTGVGHSSFGQIFDSKGGSNFTKYDNKIVDEKTAEMRTTVGDEDKADQLAVDIDRELFKDGYGLPLFQTTGVLGIKDRVKGIERYNPGSAGIYWNVQDWDVTS